MSEPKFSTFHLRLPVDLREQLLANKGGNSLNTEIIERLRSTFEVEPALQIAQKLRPVLSALSDSDRARVVELTSETFDILASRTTRKRRT